VLSTTDKGAVGVLKEMKRTQSKAAILITQSAFTPLVTAPARGARGHLRYTEFDPTSSTDPRVQAFIETSRAATARAPTQLARRPTICCSGKYLVEETRRPGRRARLRVNAMCSPKTRRAQGLEEYFRPMSIVAAVMRETGHRAGVRGGKPSG